MKISSVLVVEDELFILDLYQEILTDEGLKVFTAKDGEEALEFFKAGKKVDVVLLDIMMPRLSGLNLLRAIAGDKKIRKPPIILLTNLPDKDVINHCYKLGACGIIMKSDITPDQLLPQIKTILETKKKQ